MVEYQSLKYHQGCEALFKLLDETRGNWDLSNIVLPTLCPADDFIKDNPSFLSMVVQVENKVRYQLTKSQMSWAVVMFKRTTWDGYRLSIGQTSVVGKMQADNIAVPDSMPDSKSVVQATWNRESET